MTAWQSRWGTHDHLPPHHWDSANAQIERLLPSLQHEREVITVDQLRAFVRSRKPTCAVARLDGISRADPLAMPSADLHGYCVDVDRIHCFFEVPVFLTYFSSFFTLSTSLMFSVGQVSVGVPVFIAGLRHVVISRL